MNPGLFILRWSDQRVVSQARPEINELERALKAQFQAIKRCFVETDVAGLISRPELAPHRLRWSH